MASSVHIAHRVKWAGSGDWEKHRAIITQLYSLENRTLKEVIELMEDKHNFYATPKMYKHRLKRWGLAKYAKNPPAKASRASRGTDSTKDQSKPVDVTTQFDMVSRTRLLGSQPVDNLSLGRPGFTWIPVKVSSPFFHEESIYHATRAYYDASFDSLSTWTEISPLTGANQIKPGAIQVREQLQDLHSRFRIALNKLTGPKPLDPTDLADGIKMMRVFFARLPDVLIAQDPMLIVNILDLVGRVQDSGHAFLETQMRRHIAWLARTQGQPRSTTLLSHILSTNFPLDGYHRCLLIQIAVEMFQKYLGPYNFETLQMQTWYIVMSKADIFSRIDGIRQLYARLEAGAGKDVFDDRHLDVLMNISNHHLRAGDSEQTLDVVNSILTNPARMKVLDEWPDHKYVFYWLAGKALGKQEKHREAETYIRLALSVVQEKIDNGDEDDSSYLSGLTALENNLRDQNKLDEAGEVLAKRQAHVRESLLKVGEKEDET